MPMIMKTRMAGLGAASPCDLPGAWVVVLAGDGKYYNTCMATGEKFEVDALSATQEGYLKTVAGGSSSQIISGIDNVYLLGGAAAAVALLMFTMRR